MDKDKAKHKLSYAIAVQIAQNLTQNGFNDLDPSAFTEGIIDVIENNDLQLSAEEVNQAIEAHYAIFKEKAMEENDGEGKAFLIDNSKKEGVITLPSGLQYRIINKGNGKKPTLDSFVTTHYTGRTIHGKVFDSSIDRGEPASFPVNGVIKGWTEILQLMSVGEKIELTIPSELAYGEQGAGPDIPPYSTLIFELELLEVKP